MILQEIAHYTKKRVELEKLQLPLSELQKLATTSSRPPFAFETALRSHYPAIISEVKKASPSKGIISPQFPYLEIAKEYEACGATCISVLTEPKWFLGSDQIFREIRQEVSLPMLRKDFVIDAYQIYQAKALGADCVLLICALLSFQELKAFSTLCKELGMSTLVEAHDLEEIQLALQVGATIIGVNNRNLKNFSVNLGNASQLAKHIPDEVIYIAESGVETPAHGISQIQQGAHGLLIGEALMKAPSIGSFIEEITTHPYENQNRRMCI